MKSKMPFSPPMPRSFTAASVRANAPVLPGVYGISNAREWIYIGQADNIQAALLNHLRGVETPVLDRQPTGFIFEVCELALQPGRLDRLVREYNPVCNQLAERHSW
jgi:hypothetical protein